MNLLLKRYLLTGGRFVRGMSFFSKRKTSDEILQLAKIDVRISAIALFRKLTLLTRNHRDSGKVAGLYQI